MALTDKDAARTGLGRFIPNDDPSIPGLNPDLLCLPDLLPADFRSAMIGKWHLATPKGSGHPRDVADHPARCGFDVFRGTPGNLQKRGQSYSKFEWVMARKEALEGVSIKSSTDSYVTSFTTDEALNTIREFGAKPWLLWVGNHAPHRPIKVPPRHLIHNKDLKTRPELAKAKPWTWRLGAPVSIKRTSESVTPRANAKSESPVPDCRAASSAFASHRLVR